MFWVALERHSCINACQFESKILKEIENHIFCSSVNQKEDVFFNSKILLIHTETVVVKIKDGKQFIRYIIFKYGIRWIR